MTRMARKSLTLVRVGPGDDRVAERLEQRVGVVVGERARAGRGRARRARARVSGVTSAPAAGLAAVDAVGVAGQRPDAGQRRRAPPRGRAGTRRCARPGPCRAPSPWSRRPTGARRAAAADGRTRRRRGRCPPSPCRPPPPRPRARRRGSAASPPPPAPTSAAASSDSRGVAISRVSAVREPRIARLRRLVRAPPRGGARTDGGSLDAVAGEDAPRPRRRWSGSATVGPEAIAAGSSPGTSETIRLTTRRGKGRGGEPAALYCRKVPAHGVHLGDVGAAAQQRAHSPPACPRSGMPSAGSASSAEPPPEIRQSTRSSGPAARAIASIRAAARMPGGVGHRMRRLDDLDALAGHAVAVAGDDEALERPVPGLLHRPRHRRRGLAGPEDDGAPLRRRRQVAGDDRRGLCRRHRGIEQPPQELGWRNGHGRSRGRRSPPACGSPACRPRSGAGGGLEPPRLSATAPKSGASTIPPRPRGWQLEGRTARLSAPAQAAHEAGAPERHAKSTSADARSLSSRRPRR